MEIELELEITATGDDGRVLFSKSSISTSNTSLVFIGGYGFWLRFLDVTIPNSAIINSATLEMTSVATGGASVVGNFSIGDIDDAVNPTTTTEFEEAVKTDEVVWTAPGTITTGLLLEVTGLETIVGQVINREGWESGNSLIIYQECDDGGTLSIASFDNTTYDSAKLIINYTRTDLPVISNLTQVLKKSRQIIVGFTLESIGLFDVTEIGVEYGVESGVYTETVSSAGSIAVGLKNFDLSGLTPMTSYYMRAFATNSGGTTYSEESMFTTSGFPGTTEVTNLPTTPTSVTNITI
jgi:hypothetical protein